MTQAYTLTVSKFNNIVKDIFNSEELLHNIKIVGEVFGISLSKNSVYFSIKDEDSSLPAVCFYSDIMKNISEGDMVVLTGSPNFYTKSGRFNFVVNKVEPFGLGLLYQKFLDLKDKLQKEGLFDAVHKKSLPDTIKRIGVVTSKDGAVLQDIKNVVWRRNQAVDLILYDTKVQGNNAELEIVQGINFFSEYNGVDVVVVARGGGSLEDLSAFNTEIVARAVYDCKKPLVSAVGHETDFTIIDFVSDLRAPTPSAAAELLTKDNKISQTTLKKEISTITRILNGYVADKNLQLSSAKRTFLNLSADFLEEKKSEFEKNIRKLTTKLGFVLMEHEHQTKLLKTRINKLNPLDILARGYAKIEQDGKSVNLKEELNLNKSFEINFIDGQISAKGE